jgi:hypothetical protein
LQKGEHSINIDFDLPQLLGAPTVLVSYDVACTWSPTPFKRRKVERSEIPLRSVALSRYIGFCFVSFDGLIYLAVLSMALHTVTTASMSQAKVSR